MRKSQIMKITLPNSPRHVAVAALQRAWAEETKNINNSKGNLVWELGVGILGVIGLLALMADDATGIGAADDPLIPPVAARTTLAGVRIWQKIFPKRVAVPKIKFPPKPPIPTGVY